MTAERPPGRKTGWMPFASLLLGMLAFLTSFLFIWLAVNGLLTWAGYRFFTEHRTFFWLYYGGGMFLFIPVNLVLALLGLTFGFADLEHGVGRNRVAKAGITLCSVAILSGIPAMLVFFAVLRAA